MAFAPGGEQLGVVVKRQRVIFGLERMLRPPVVMPKNLLVKLAPDQFIQPGLRAFIACAQANCASERMDTAPKRRCGDRYDGPLLAENPACRW